MARIIAGCLSANAFLNQKRRFAHCKRHRTTVVRIHQSVGRIPQPIAALVMNERISGSFCRYGFCRSPANNLRRFYMTLLDKSVSAIALHFVRSLISSVMPLATRLPQITALGWERALATATTNWPISTFSDLTAGICGAAGPAEKPLTTPTQRWVCCLAVPTVLASLRWRWQSNSGGFAKHFRLYPLV